jgi:hypothetical protein
MNELYKVYIMSEKYSKKQSSYLRNCICYTIRYPGYVTCSIFQNQVEKTAEFVVRALTVAVSGEEGGFAVLSISINFG